MGSGLSRPAVDAQLRSDAVVGPALGPRAVPAGAVAAVCAWLPLSAVKGSVRDIGRFVTAFDTALLPAGVPFDDDACAALARKCPALASLSVGGPPAPPASASAASASASASPSLASAGPLVTPAGLGGLLCDAGHRALRRLELRDGPGLSLAAFDVAAALAAAPSLRELGVTGSGRDTGREGRWLLLLRPAAADGAEGGAGGGAAGEGPSGPAALSVLRLSRLSLTHRHLKCAAACFPRVAALSVVECTIAPPAAGSDPLGSDHLAAGRRGSHGSAAAAPAAAAGPPPPGASLPLPRLTALDLSRSAVVGDAEVVLLVGRAPRLRELALAEAWLTAAGLRRVARLCPRLRSLSLRAALVDDGFFADLLRPPRCSLPLLRELCVAETAATGATVVPELFPALRSVDAALTPATPRTLLCGMWNPAVVVKWP